MSPPPASRAVKIGHALVTGLLVLALAFGALAVASIGVGLARDGDSLLYGDTLMVPLALSPDDVGPLPADVSPRGWTPVNLEIEDPTSEQMFLRSAQDLGPLALFIACLWLLRRFLRSVLDGDPFGPPNVQRLRALGFILVLGAPVVELVDTSLRQALYEESPAQPSIDLGVAGFSLPAGALLGGLGAFILAEVFAYGLRLREDVAGTV